MHANNLFYLRICKGLTLLNYTICIHIPVFVDNINKLRYLIFISNNCQQNDVKVS